MVTYPGNLERLTFGETGERGLVLAALAPDGTVTTQRHVLARVEMYDVNVDASGCRTIDDVRDRLTAELERLPQEGPVRVARVFVAGELAGALNITEADLTTVSHRLAPDLT